MHVEALTPEVSELLEERKWTAEEYHAMRRAGILDEDDRVELIDGKIIHRTPIGNAHIRCVTRLNRLITRFLLERDDPALFVSPQNPMRLGPHDEPEPDLAVVHLPEDPETPIGPEHVLLLVEVAETSVQKDREVKLPRYAAAGIPEVWIVVLPDERVEVYREPSAKGYKQAQFLEEEDTLDVAALPDAGAIAVADVFL